MSVEILIVDDEPDIRSLIALTLEDEGFQTVQASNAEEARNFIASRPPTCIILDIWMRDSDMDGLEIAEMVPVRLSRSASADDFRSWHNRNSCSGNPSWRV